MKSLLIGIGVGLIISLFGSVIVAASVDKNEAIRVFLGGMGIILLTIGSLTFLIHTIAAGVKLGNDLSKK
jgi:hypothetical protein